MPEYTHKELAADRIASGKPQWKVAAEIGQSETTIKRWETGKWLTKDCRMPHPDDILLYLKAIGKPERWRDWMRSHYDSCREMLPPTLPLNDLLYAVDHSESEVNDFANLFSDVRQSIFSGVIGKIDCLELKMRFLKEAKEAQAAIATLVVQLEKDI